jgi:hypothetical protein
VFEILFDAVYTSTKENSFWLQYEWFFSNLYVSAINERQGQWHVQNIKEHKSNWLSCFPFDKIHKYKSYSMPKIGIHINSWDILY